MNLKIALLLFLVLLLSSNCHQDSNPIVQDESKIGYNKLMIMTDSSEYNWQLDDLSFSIIIQGNLLNNSDTVFYSRIGDGFGPPEQSNLYFSGNSEGYLEKYNSDEDTWEVQSFSSVLIEGTRMVPLKFSQEYSISSNLTRMSDHTEIGIYRFRMDYYDIADPDSNTVPYYDYSNTFEIK